MCSRGRRLPSVGVGGSRPDLSMGFTLVELLVVIAVIGVLMALLLPAVQAAREAVRRAKCSNNLKQIGLALHGYHATHRSFCPGRAGTSGPGGMSQYHNNNSLNGWVLLLPFMEQDPLYSSITSPQTYAGHSFNPWGPSHGHWSIQHYEPWKEQVPGLLCPSDQHEAAPNTLGFGLCNYKFSVGDTIYWNSHSSNPRGLFGLHSRVRFADVRDGTSNTLACSEGCFPNNPRAVKEAYVEDRIDVHVDPTVCLDAAVAGELVGSTGWRQYFWASGYIELGITTVIPPNGPSCLAARGPCAHAHGGIWTPSSHHPGGVNGLLADGSVRFISEGIDAGDLSEAEPEPHPWILPNRPIRNSPYGVWGALGSKHGGEVPGDF